MLNDGDLIIKYDAREVLTLFERVDNVIDHKLFPIIGDIPFNLLG